MSTSLPQDTKRRALGRGLDALLPSAPSSTGNARASLEAFYAPIEALHSSSQQPRTHFESNALDELAASIRSVGVLEPILVRARVMSAGGGYEIVAGERRWRAAQRAGLHEVPVFVKELTTEQTFEAALVENVQREDLNAIEVARALDRLIRQYGHTQEDLASRIGKNRTTIANALRLLKLPTAVLTRIEKGELSEGHGRALLGASDTAAMEKLAQLAIEHAWSVRETERRARRQRPDKRPDNHPAERTGALPKSVNVRDLETRLSQTLGTQVTIADRKGRGHLQINFSSYDELDRLLNRLL